MLDNAASAGAHGSAHADFFFAAGGLREKQIGQIDAGNQKDEADDTHHQTTGQSDLAALVDPHGSFSKGCEGYAAAGVIRGEGALHARGNGFERGLRNALRDFVFQPAIHGRGQKAARVEILLEEAREHLRVHADGNPDLLRVVESERALKSGRSDADNRVRRGVEGDRLANRV